MMGHRRLARNSLPAGNEIIQNPGSSGSRIAEVGAANICPIFGPSHIAQNGHKPGRCIAMGQSTPR
jgi:hypothetical protein